MIPESEYDNYYGRYIKPAESNGKTILENLHSSFEEFENFLNGLSEDKQNYAYEDGKWTVKELLQHVIDTERVFNYRALSFARDETTELPSFDQDKFIENANAQNKNFTTLLEELKLVRFNTILLFDSFSEQDLKKKGKAGGANLSVRAIGYLLVGHQNHHFSILKERYF